MSNTFKKLIIPFIISLTSVSIIFILHYFYPSLINNYNNPPHQLSGEFMQRIWNRHMTHPAFAGRPLTSLAIQFLHEFFDLNYSLSFVVINFSLLIICGVLIYKIARASKLDHREALLSIILFYVSSTILFAFFSSIDSYDEPIQYVFLFLTILLLKKEKWIGSSITLFFSLVARETSILLFPALILIFFKTQTPLLSSKNIIHFKKIFIFIIPVVAYMIITSLILFNKDLIKESGTYLAEERVAHWQFNFQNERFSIESLVCIITTLGFPLFIALEYLYKHNVTKEEQRYFSALLLTCFLNTAIVLLTARARESRLFALPLLLWWPILGKYVYMLIKNLNLKDYILYFSYQRLLNTSLLFLFFILLPIYYLLSFQIYRPTYSGGFANGYQTYLFILLTVVSYYIYLKIHQKINSSFHKEDSSYAHHRN